MTAAWERLGEAGERAREGYASGWGEVLGRYGEAAAGK